MEWVCSYGKYWVKGNVCVVKIKKKKNTHTFALPAELKIDMISWGIYLKFLFTTTLAKIFLYGPIFFTLLILYFYLVIN